MSEQAGARDVGSCIAARYWLTPAGEAALTAYLGAAEDEDE